MCIRDRDNVYESGVSGIFEDLGEKIDLPEELYIINPFSLTYGGDGEILKFYGFFWGKDEGGEEHTYLLDYDRAKDRRMTVWLDGEGDSREYPGKRFMPFLELMDGVRPVSYTHLDVYKRQENNSDSGSSGERNRKSPNQSACVLGFGPHN